MRLAGRQSSAAPPAERAGRAACLGVAALLLGTAARAGTDGPSLPDVAFDATVSAAGDDGQPREVRGHMHVRNWHPRDHRFCIYLPYEDPDFGEDSGTNRRFEMLSAKTGTIGFEGGGLQLALAGGVQARPGIPAHVVPLTLTPAAAAAGEVTFEFTATVPRLRSSDPKNWFYDGYLPELLDTCPAPRLDPQYYRRPLAAAFHGTLTLPTGWEYAGPGVAGTDGRIAVAISSRTVAFALGQGFKKLRFDAGGVPVTLLYHRDSFTELVDTIKETLPAMSRILGPYPFGTLTIVETSELQRHGLPGLIAMNRPRQMLFDQAQKSWLNWHHWIFAIQLAHQWYGGAVAAATPDDDWLINGIAEFATLETLSRHQQRFNLFNQGEGGLRLLSFDYLQISELTAATLQNTAPFAVLTNADLTTRDPAPKQHPLLFVKQAFALRQLKSYAGDSAFFGFLRNVTSHHRDRFLTPEDFAAALGQLPSPFPPTVRQDLATYLKRWWTSDGWPDFALTGFTSEPLPGGQWVAHVTAKQDGGIDFPPLIGVKDDTDKTVMARATAAGGEWTATVVTADKPLVATVDPTHETFDADRFNNSSESHSLAIFPGGADTLHDDAETLIWLPYAFKHPGEPFSVGLQAALFRYIQSGLLARVETAPSTHQGAFDISHSYQIPRSALNGSFSATGDYYNDRQAQALIKRSPVLVTDPSLSLAVGARHKAQAGQAETEHSTAIVVADLSPVGVKRDCTYGLNLSYEKAPLALAHGFSYDRSVGSAVVDCHMTPRSSLTLRGFRGEVAGDGVLPQAALFKPTDLGEARLRLDRMGAGWVEAIDTGGADLLFPFYLPLPSDSMILARQMRWRVFYDVGRSVGPTLLYRDGGLGILMPLGGDLSGAGSLAFTRLSLLAVLYSEVGDVVSRRPSILFDITGQL